MCAGDVYRVRVLHRHLNSLVLSENTPDHARPGHPQPVRLRPSDRPLRQPLGLGGAGVFAVVVFVVAVRRRQRPAAVAARQAAHRPARSVLLHRVRLQRLVYVRAGRSVHRQSEQAGLRTRACEHRRQSGTSQHDLLERS